MRDAASLLYARVFINTTWFTVPSPSTIAKHNTSYIAPDTLKLSGECGCLHRIGHDNNISKFQFLTEISMKYSVKILHVCDYDWPWMPGNSEIMYYKILFDMHYLFVMGFSNNLSWKTQANMIWKCESKSFTFLEKFSFWNHINEHRKYRDRDKNWRMRRDELIHKAKIQHSNIWRWNVELEKKTRKTVPTQKRTK